MMDVLVSDDWSVVCEPADPEEPQEGLIVYLKSEDAKREVSRVAYKRGGTMNAKAQFDEQLQREIDLARHIAEIVNKHASAKQGAWSVVCWPVERDRSQHLNNGGVMVAVARADEYDDDPEDWQIAPVSQVAFKRRNAKLTDVEFETQLRREVELAETVADTLNSHHKRIHV